ncbi:MAG: hypothetical protein WC477_00665 [Patescibacteria group bacterium]
MTDIPIDSLSAPIATAASSPFGMVAAAVIGFFILLFLFLLIWLARRMLRRTDLTGLSREQVIEKWKTIQAFSEKGSMGLKMSIVEADSLLDGVLKSMMIPGIDLGERLRAASYKYPELRHVWFAHRLRNQIVHETTFELQPRDGREAMKAYERALKTLRIL